MVGVSTPHPRLLVLHVVITVPACGGSGGAVVGVSARARRSHGGRPLEPIQSLRRRIEQLHQIQARNIRNKIMGGQCSARRAYDSLEPQDPRPGQPSSNFPCWNRAKELIVRAYLPRQGLDRCP